MSLITGNGPLETHWKKLKFSDNFYRYFWFALEKEDVEMQFFLANGDFMKKVLLATWVLSGIDR